MITRSTLEGEVDQVIIQRRGDTHHRGRVVYSIHFGHSLINAHALELTEYKHTVQYTIMISKSFKKVD